jgi:hypothetical protein
MSAHVRDELVEQFGRCAGQVQVNTLGRAWINTLGGVQAYIGTLRIRSGQHWHHQDEFRSASECVRIDYISGQPIAKPSSSTYTLVWYLDSVYEVGR